MTPFIDYFVFRRYDIFKKANILYCETSEDVRERIMAIVEEEVSEVTSETVSACAFHLNFSLISMNG